jgi:hypothetical protein
MSRHIEFRCMGMIVAQCIPQPCGVHVSEWLGYVEAGRAQAQLLLDRQRWWRFSTGECSATTPPRQ